MPQKEERQPCRLPKPVMEDRGVVEKQCTTRRSASPQAVGSQRIHVTQDGVGAEDLPLTEILAAQPIDFWLNAQKAVDLFRASEAGLDLPRPLVRAS